jgi:hypothetical protein
MMGLIFWIMLLMGLISLMGHKQFLGQNVIIVMAKGQYIDK